MDQPKYWLSSQTIVSALVAFGSGLSLLATNPDFYRQTADYAHKMGAEKIADRIRNYVLPTVILLSSIGALAGRTRKGDIYTDNFLPGPNKATLLAEADRAMVEQNTKWRQLTDRAEAAEEGQAEITKTVSEVLSKIALPDYQPQAKPDRREITLAELAEMATKAVP